MSKFTSAPMAIATLAATALVAFATPAAAETEYPWCAQYTGRAGGARNCGFVSYEQCMATVRGMGGFCEHNLFYTGAAKRPVRHKRKHHDD